MSATNRGSERKEYDNYETPAYCVRRLLEVNELPLDGRWLDPCAGSGAIVKAVQAVAVNQDCDWTSYDIRPECEEPLSDISDTYWIGDFLSDNRFVAEDLLKGFDVAILNPPYNQAEEFIKKLVPHCRYTAALLRLNFLASVKRAAWLSMSMPDVYVLPNRPSFTGEGTDATEYAWMIWTRNYGARKSSGKVSILAQTPVAERR